MGVSKSTVLGQVAKAIKEEESAGNSFCCVLEGVIEAIEKTFGAKVLELRKQRGWKQEELGKKLETSSVVVGRYERGEMMPSIKVAKKMAQAFGVTVDYLLGEQHVPDLLTQRDMVQRWTTLDALPPDDRDRILYVVDSLIREAKTREAFGAA